MIEPIHLPSDIDTPCVVVDFERLQSNIDRMASGLRQRGVALRPHAKTHKSTHIARMQTSAGATGLTVATLAEAEGLVSAGFEDVFIAYTLWPNEAKGRRLRGLMEQARIAVGVDSVDAAEQLGRMTRGVARQLDVLIEIDSGAHRCGVLPEQAGLIADAVARNGMRALGAFTHGGHAYDGPESVAAAAEDERASLERAGLSMQRHGHEPAVLSAGSSPTALLSSRPPVTEERPGEYVFGDRDLLSVGACHSNEIALMVASTVVSTAVSGRFVIDAGTKLLGREPSDLLPGYGGIAGHDDSDLIKLSEEHGIVGRDGSAPKLGEVVAVVPNHVCPVVSQARELFVVSQGRLVDVWPVDLPSRSLSQRPGLS